MKKKILNIVPIILLIFILQAFLPINNTTDFLSVNNIKYHKENYILAWSIYDRNYIKQEYLRDKDSINNFNKMITLDILQGELTPEELVADKIQELEKRKTIDSLVNYQVIENNKKGEYILDFIISNDSIYEWNAYRYKKINTNKGNAVLLFAYTLHSFEGAEINTDDFFPYLISNRKSLINIIIEFNIPSIYIKN